MEIKPPAIPNSFEALELLPQSVLSSDTPDSRLPTPGSRLPTPDSRLSTPDSRLPTPDSRLPTP
ncbi:hypothetical protein [Moorena sp. SIO3E8]|uniref:hypothetical protein n=1 Tax=Moorena sp. SIO3E8 TaxID=2607830 RepID=UPI001417A8F8|nr:hypothetical protein [Moorena sp. SIO3E8]NEO12095.1 hypothetical protein [Moorena sp. SIO3E8]